MIRAMFLISMLTCAPLLRACPVCDSVTGEQVRAGIAGEGMVTAALGTLLPFAVTAGVVAVVHFGGRGGPARRRDDGER